MKRFILLLAVALGMSAPAHAQLEICDTQDEKMEYHVLASMWNYLHVRGDVWHIVMKTDVDVDEFVWLKLGNNLEDAVTSVLQFEEALKKMADGVCYSVTDRDGESIFIMNYQPLIKKHGFTVHGNHKLGTAYLNTGSITRAKVILLTERNRRYQEYVNSKK